MPRPPYVGPPREPINPFRGGGGVGARNGVRPNGAGMRLLAQLVNDTLAKRLKVVFRQSYIASSTDCYGGAASTDTWGWRARTSPAAAMLACRMALWPITQTKGAPGIDPRCYWTVGGVAQPTIRETRR